MDLLDRKKEILKAREDYILFRENDITAVRDEIISSWDRSREYGIDIDLYLESTEEELKKQEDSIKRHGNFIDIARPYMVDLYNLIEDSGFIIFLTDANGYILDSFKDMDRFESVNINKSLVNLNEKKLGTNAVGTCLYLDQPFETLGEEFWCKALQRFSTSAAPIHDRDGSLIGCIAITGFADIFPVHTLGMATAIAYAIESRINLSIKNEASSIVQDYTNFINQSISDGIIVLDNRGNIKSTNKIAANILNVEEKNVPGKNINEIVKAPFDFNKVMREHLDFYNNEITIYIANKPARCRISITNLRNGVESIGLIIVLKKVPNHLTSEPVGTAKNKLFTFDDIIGNSEAIRKMKEIAAVASNGKSNVLIMGESGTGKELVAQAIHNNSSRRNKPFIAINCGALPVNLAESELFGYEGGAYTGSKKEGQIGKFEQADGGTIFLDEIGEMPLSIQTALLRAIQEKKVVKVGGTRSKDIDIRVIAATNKNLFEAVSNNTFRMDLFYRLNVFTITIPPLRDRREDIFSLVHYFIDKYNDNFGTDIVGVTKEAKEIMAAYDWFGNVRELENTIERAVQIAQQPLIDIDDLPIYMQSNSRRYTSKVHMEADGIKPREYDTLLAAMKANNGNVKAVAEDLGISRITVYRRIAKLGIDLEEFREKR